MNLKKMLLLIASDMYGNVAGFPKIENEEYLKENGFQRQGSSIEGIEYEYVNQYSVGDSGDSYAGEMAYLMDDGDYFVLPFVC